ncbi:small, acid-soluble spore protein, alpha/beta type [Clostridioides sp. ES-W-0017-02]|nr:small, acid-soluble spore protein, alpha/beta type [Clostridioides sp. ES-S-0049-03]MCC0677392.1 small, acid-soluble spore protein, alpha/beta type [Clostridioides sp. ES-W-0018-02]MCC0712540.1 small, acid-soluble spore protein, alpha/beta type [Clostridioides sp. ES-W-0017-02]
MKENMKREKKITNGKNTKILTNDDIMKYEIASELGLMDKVGEHGWAGLTAKEAGRIGGMLTSRKKRLRKIVEGQNKKDESI